MNKNTSHAMFLKLTKAERLEAIEMLIKKLNSFDEVEIIISALDLYLSRPTTTCMADFVDEDEGHDSAQDAHTDNVGNETSKNLKVYSKIKTGHLRFSCEYCDKKFKSQARFKFHVKQFHTGELLFHCKNCDKQLTSEKSYKRHMKLYHDDENEVFSCKKCDKKCISKESLYKHNQRVHEKVERFICDICSKPFAFKSDLEKHQRVHTGEKPYACSICLKRFNQNSNLKKHLKFTHHLQFIHEKESEVNTFPAKSLQCPMREKRSFLREICNNKLSSKWSYERHTKLNHDNPKEKELFPRKKLFPCENCDKLLTSESKYKRHMKLYHDGENDVFSCKKCDKKFSSKGGLNVHHRKVHGEIERFICHVCSKPWGSKADLVRHIRVHTGEKPYTCSVCSKTFNRFSHLKRHMRAVHKEEN